MVFCGTLGFIHRMSNLKRIIESAKSNPKTPQEEKYNEKLTKKYLTGYVTYMHLTKDM